MAIRGKGMTKSRDTQILDQLYDVAVDRGRSLETVRAQVRAIMQKSALQAFSSEAILYTQTDWAPFMQALKGNVPVHFLWGSESQLVAPETYGEFKQDYDRGQFHRYEGVARVAPFLMVFLA